MFMSLLFRKFKIKMFKSTQNTKLIDYWTLLPIRSLAKTGSIEASEFC